MRVATVGHSTRELDELVELFRAHGVELLVDVRRYPASRRHPHFARETLERALPAAGLAYLWAPGLGGRRHRRADTRHTAWRIPAFAAYADHIETPEFERAASDLLEQARERFTAILCAEARPEQCHRRLIADWLTVHGVEVVHLMSRTRAVPHHLPDFARVEGGRLIYDGGQLSL